jgi:retron-type reverse transcriptase
VAKPIEKPDGSMRQPFDAHPPLKDVHLRIKKKILSRIIFPDYLTGSLKGKDYKVNAALHAGAKIVICEDISTFFPSTKADNVFDIWRFFFGFSNEVANCLTRLTTKDGALPQGAITSSYLANLAFWREEPRVHAYFTRIGVTYSRYVDDMGLSSRRFLTPDEKTSVISTVYGMLASKGYKAKRQKHELQTSKGRMFVTKLLVNDRPALVRKERSAIRAAVFQLEEQKCSEDSRLLTKKEYNRSLGRVSKLSRFHKTQGEELMQRMQTLRPFIE